MKPWHARSNARRSALRRARRRLLSPHSSPQQKHRAIAELYEHIEQPNLSRRVEACKAIFESDYVRSWIPPGRSPAQLRADERRARRKRTTPPAQRP